MTEFQTITVPDRCKEIFDLQKNYVKIDQQLHVILSHFGYFSQDLVNGFSENVEEILTSAGEKKQIIKRIFSILIEGLQNIRVHGEADADGKYYGSFILAKDETKYSIIFGSLIKRENKITLEKRIENLNILEEDQTKEHYMSVLTNGIASATGNAGLGFITMKLKSKSNIKAKFYSVSEGLYFFTTELNLLKEK
ncbi:MAG: SiaB family protein kinase [Flavobacteriia bacterium]|jgi:hypothetical protein